MIRRLLVLASCILCVFFTFGQETTSDIQGTVSDGKAGLAGATVTALHTPTGTRYTTTTRKDGRFNLANVRIGGPYTITVTFVGFKEEKQDNINLSLGQEFKADFSMSQDAKQLSEVIVSTARQGKIFNTSHTGSQEVITRAQIERLPTVNRSLQDFAKLTPTANMTTSNGQITGMSFGGQSNQYNNLTIDGANFNNSFGLSGTLGGQTNSQPISLDAIEQIQVNISPYDVRQGGFSGAGVNGVTKSGSNTFRGTVYDYTKGASTQGYNIHTTTLPKQTFSYSLRGAALGGFFIPNKVFFFVSVEQERRTDPGTSYIASDASHAPNISSISNANADTLNKLRQYLITNYKYDPGAFQGYSYKTQSDKVTAKLDWNIDSHNTFTFKYNYLKSSRDAPASNSGSVNTIYGRAPGQYAMPFYSSGYTINNNFNIYIAELNTRFSNKASNKLQVGYTALRDSRTALSPSAFPLVDILDGAGNPYTSFGYEQYTYGNVLKTDVYQFSDIFTYYTGGHEITLGTQDSWKTYKNGFSPSYNGVFRFSSLSDFYNNKPALRYDLSASLTKDGSFPLVGPKDQEYGFFIQDKWRVKNNFTVTYGLRADIAAFQNTFLYNPVVDTLTRFRNGVHLNTGQGPKTSVQFSPRLGFNWDVNSDQKTQVRGGVGLFQGPPPFVWISNQASNSGVALFGSISNGSGYVFNQNVDAYRSQITSAGAGLSKSYSINVTDPHFKFPQALKSSLAIDQKLPENFVVTLEATYAKDINAAFFQNLNLPTTGTTLAGADNRTRYYANQIYPVGGSAAASINNPSIGNAIYMTNVNGGYAYTATLQVQKTFRNLYLDVAYSYMKAKDVMVGGSTASTMWGSKPTVGDPNNPEVGYSNAYLPHRVIAAASYRIEYAKHLATSIGLFYEAAPAGVGSYTYNGDLLNTTFANNVLMYIPRNSSEINLEASAPSSSGVVDPRTPAQIWSQLNSFISQDAYLSKHRGQYAQRNALIYPWFKRLDLNVTQDIYFFTGKTHKDRHTLRFTMDIVNVGNLLNKNWGVYKLPNATSFLKYDKLAADGKTPIFSFPFADPNNLVPYTSSFRDDTSILSRWQMQLGFRYLFN